MLQEKFIKIDALGDIHKEFHNSILIEELLWVSEKVNLRDFNCVRLLSFCQTAKFPIFF